MTQYFFDQNNNFQWASIAAVVSFLTLCSTIISIYLTHLQGRKNRKSSTLVSLRLEELKALREESYALLLLIKEYLNEKNAGKPPGVKVISKTDPVLNELSTYFNKIQAKLYRKAQHEGEFSIKISMCLMKLLVLEDTGVLTDIQIEFERALQEYSNHEYKDIENVL